MLGAHMISHLVNEHLFIKKRIELIEQRILVIYFVRRMLNTLGNCILIRH